MRKPLVVGNWKMNGTSESILTLVDELVKIEDSACDLLVCPPAAYLQQVYLGLECSHIGLSAQNVDTHSNGAYTGEHSAAMLIDCGCTHTLVGHSERREIYGETDETVAEKFVKAISAGLKPILCVGESLEEREAGKTVEVVHRQINAVLKKAGIEVFARGIIAYEPVWAIGTGMSATAEQAEAVHLSIRQLVENQKKEIGEQIQILYGGSVNATNAAGLFAQNNIDGALVGGASLDAEAFSVIYRAAARPLVDG